MKNLIKLTICAIVGSINGLAVYCALFALMGMRMPVIALMGSLIITAIMVWIVRTGFNKIKEMNEIMKIEEGGK